MTGTTSHHTAELLTNEARILLVPHSHWDREWYEPFQRFRLRLVELMDEVLAHAERDPRFRFTVDGQMAAIDDYLEVRPENRDRVRTLVGSGQLAIGPWQILLDEFLCSGENIVRNLELGMARSRDLGGSMPIGYLPDMFGHCAQMPQVLARAGLRHACLWRGVPQDIDGHAFHWQAPDGSLVRAEYLPAGYSNAAYLFDDPSEVPAKVHDFVVRMQPWYGGDEILAMYGTDHTSPAPDLLEMLALPDGPPDGPQMHVGTLTDYVLGREGSQEQLPTWHGELRSHSRANILPGVISARGHLKLAMSRAERMVERYAEPWAALHSRTWPENYLDMAWQRLIASACHDSVTGCGVDETAVQVAARMAEAEQLGQAVRDAVIAEVARGVPHDRLVVLNPTPQRRVDWVEVQVPIVGDGSGVTLQLADGERFATQELSRADPVLSEQSVDADALMRVFDSVHGRELFGQTVLSVQLDAQIRSVTFIVGPVLRAQSLDLAQMRRAVDEAVNDGELWMLRIAEEPRCTVGALLPVPPLGWTTARPISGDSSVQDPVRLDGYTLDNGLLRVSVGETGAVSMVAADGTVVTDALRLVDGGDRGDTYNFAPPLTDTVVDLPEQVSIAVHSRGPLMAALTVHRKYAWPTHVELPADRRSSHTVCIPTSTRLELRSGEPFLRVGVSLDNRCRDHRLRLHVPLPERSHQSHAEGQFAVVTRGLTSQAGWGEMPIPTFPASGFVDAGGVALILDRPSEYELVDGGRELALTVLRAVGLLSRHVHPYRSETAGPQLETPGAQSMGGMTIELAVLPHSGSWHAAGLLSAAERWRHDLVSTPGQAAEAGDAAAGSAGLEIVGDGVAMSSLRRRGEWLELRLVAEHPEPVAVTVRGALLAARRCDLLGVPGQVLSVDEGVLRMTMQPWEIATVQLRR